MLPLSTFGFGDELRGEPGAWHPAADGLRTVDRLLRSLGEDAGLVTDPALAAAELNGWRRRLEAADGLGVPFCLHLRIDIGVSGHEFDVRAGSY